ncbi:hypothetical protein [Arthrobacter wenxiniae]|uniref:Uncharacterized protein n=1 Tax=Arthrobacter wenxiniae TaxID=2713570 RepID=A0A7Y7LZ00_9MICC|nr:hypothetical protein [Arthrobacter wenxiniae]NVM94223.1 hypothetical protein [Arthrobacter wenxiniae]
MTEAPSNAVTHAEATNPSIRIDVGPVHIAFLVSEDGAGFASPSQHSG